MNILRKVVLKHGSMELVLPVTPESFTSAFGIHVETVNIHGLGDLRIAGYATLGNINMDFLFPANAYSWAVTRDTAPYNIIAQLRQWAATRTVLRLIVTGTDINLPVLIESCEYGENDGSNDVSGSIYLSEYRYVGTQAASSINQGISRSVESFPRHSQTYTVQSGDSLRSVATRFYGTSGYANAIAAANDMHALQNLEPGMVLKLPEVS